MASRRACVLLLVIAVVGAIAFGREAVVDAARNAPGSFDRGSSYLQYPSAYESARSAMAFWMEKLASGPSPKGPGH
ncbi:hypothetical protein Taro_016171 [Colocasia esculenta]|uniref:Uncharacterized protein n=1 Tax=Colocasia esculenta TaxID=4460 RepID=A0A843UJX0_COLES|nr:hypothetical protein [Colocasia esculenta]